MHGLLRPVTALLMATAIAMAGHGILVMLLPLKASAANFTNLEIGLMGSGYFAGLVAGCMVAPAIISRVGHIRAFSAFTASVTAVPLLHQMFVDPYAWTMLRILQGICCAGLWLVIESWLNSAANVDTRGRILGAYTLIQLGLQTVGMQLVGSLNIEGTGLFSLAAILLSLSTLPIALTATLAPVPPKRNKLRLGWLYNVSPAATLAALLIGFATGSFWILAPLYAQDAGLSTAASALFVAVSLIAGALVQWPIGMLSDRFGRRGVMTGTALVATLASLILAVSGNDSIALIFACSIAFGAAGFPIYTVALAHANDLVSKKRAIAVSSGLLMVFSVGAASGPIIAAAVVDQAGFSALFATIAVACGLIVVFTFVRVQLRPLLPKRHREGYVMVPRTSPAIFELDPRTEDAAAISIAPESYTEPYQPAVPAVLDAAVEPSDTVIPIGGAVADTEKDPSGRIESAV